MTKQEIKPCKFANGACIHCQATEKNDCEGWVCPPQRPWVGLTEFQFAEIYNKWNDTNGSTPWGLYHAIEKALEAKNHG